MSPVGSATVRVSYEASDFAPATGLNRNSTMKVTWNEVLWATMTVGKAQADVLQDGRYSSADLVHRLSCMYAYFDLDGSGRLVRSPAFASLDPSEKGIASFYLGMTMAKLYADKVLGIPWLMHISRYAVPWSVKYGGSTKRPDLFGCNAVGDWVVAEAKGRTRVTAKLITQMQKQKSAVATINGAVPLHRYGSATRFAEGKLALRVVDPPARRDAEELPINPAAWLVDYYAPIIDMLETTDRREDGESIVGLIPGTDVEVGVPQNILGSVQDLRGRSLDRPRPRRSTEPRQSAEVGLNRHLSSQTQPEDVELVRQITEDSSVDRRVPGAFGDGLIVRSRRG